MDKPLLSVIIPVYNAENYIENTIESLMKQSFNDFEVICVNDCSTDNSAKVLEMLQNKYSKINCIFLDQNVGAGEARNVGIEKAKGQYIAFLDADDMIEQDLYEKAMALTDHGAVDRVVWGAVEEHFNDKNEHINSIEIVPEACSCYTKEEVIEKSLQLEKQTLFGYLWNSVFKADIIKNNLLRMRKSIFYEDYFFCLDFLKHSNNMVVLDYAGYHYYKRVNSSVTHSFSKDYFDLSYERVESFYNFCAEKDLLSAEAIEILGNKLLRYTLSALARNNNPLSEMRTVDRKEWVKEKIDLPLYRELLKHDFSTNPVFKVLQIFIKQKFLWLLLLMGKLVYIFRR